MERVPRNTVLQERGGVESEGRRGLIRGGLAALAVATFAKERLAGSSPEEVHEVTPMPHPQSSPEAHITIEEKEEVAEDIPSPVFDRVLDARTVEAGGLRRDQVIFVDEFGRQLTQPFDIREAEIKAVAGYSVKEVVWRYQGGKAKGIPAVWSNPKKQYVSEKTGIPVEKIEMLSVYQDMDNRDEQFAHSKVEVAYRNATRPLPDDEQGRDVLTAVRETCTFPDLPESFRPLMQSALIGILCEEARFDTDRISKKDADGLFQIMPAVAQSYNHKHKIPPAEQGTFENQAAIVSDHIRVCYQKITTELGPHLSYFADNYFGGNEASMRKYLLLPLVVNAYNGGAPLIIKMVKWYTDNYPEPETAAEIFATGTPPAGYDVYFGMVYETDRQNGVKKFGSDSSNYVEKVLGWERAFTAYEAKLKPTEVASL